MGIHQHHRYSVGQRPCAETAFQGGAQRGPPPDDRHCSWHRLPHQHPWGGKLITLAGRAGRGWRPGWCPSWLTGPRRLWWSSLPLRTVTVTLSSSLVILIVGGFFLVRQATAGIVEAKRTSAVAETTATINRIQGQLRDPICVRHLSMSGSTFLPTTPRASPTNTTSSFRDRFPASSPKACPQIRSRRT